MQNVVNLQAKIRKTGKLKQNNLQDFLPGFSIFKQKVKMLTCNSFKKGAVLKDCSYFIRILE